MYTLIIILTVIDCLLLIGVVLIQESKGGGLSSGFASNNQFLGVKKTGDILEKATWTFAIALLVLSLAAAAVQTPNQAEKAESEIKDFVDGMQVTPPEGFEVEE